MLFFGPEKKNPGDMPKSLSPPHRAPSALSAWAGQLWFFIHLGRYCFCKKHCKGLRAVVRKIRNLLGYFEAQVTQYIT